MKIFFTVLILLTKGYEGIIFYCSDVESVGENGTTYTEKIFNNWNSANYVTTDLQEIADDFMKETKSNVTFETGRSNHPLVRQTRSKIKHGLVAAAVEAYNNHIGLELSPDDLWLVIIQGVAEYLSQTENAEKHRQTFVSHEGKKKLEVDGEDHGLLPIGLRDSKHNIDPWEGIVSEFADKIKNNTKTDIADIFSSPFTTTKTVESTVFKASLMEAMQNYFVFQVKFVCLIPEIAILGTEDDYRDIQARVRRLSTLLPDLDWWFVKMQKIITKFLDAMQGVPDLDWWSRIVARDKYACYSKLTGWLSDFFPYINGISRQNGIGSLDYEDVPYGLSYTPVILVDEMYTMKTYNLRLSAGFVGVSTSCETKRVRPAVGWMILYENYTDMGLGLDINKESYVLRATEPAYTHHRQTEKITCQSNSENQSAFFNDVSDNPVKGVPLSSEKYSPDNPVNGVPLRSEKFSLLLLSVLLYFLKTFLYSSLPLFHCL